MLFISLLQYRVMKSGEHEAIQSYIDEVRSQHTSGQAREHAYRPALQNLISSFDDVKAVNDPKRSSHGNPDFIFLRQSNQQIILGYAEAKDLGVDLDKIERSDQLRRYAGYDNLFLTDYLDFRFFKNGEKYQSIRIGELQNGQITPIPESFAQLQAELSGFLEQTPEQIKSGKRLARIMGGKALRIRENVRQYLSHEEDERSKERNKELEKIYQMMRELLVHDLSTDAFADMYAQTLVYGLFVARYNDKQPDTFSRGEARDLVPRSNPFLQRFFDHIVGPDFDSRLGYIVDELCDVFRVSDVKALVHKHLRIADDQDSGDKDPIIHFYEDFLKEYDPEQRKKMGAYYTPVPVVNFIVRNVDRILKDEFGLSQGLADTSKITREINLSQEVETTKTLSSGKTIKTTATTRNEEFHRVQILDPAVGTATFLNETIKYVRQRFEGQEGRWPDYAENDLLPRLHGFELMMAPYTIAHLKLGMTLQQTGVEDISQRLGVYLTNSLEEGVPQQTDIFSFGLAEAVSEEAHEAAEVKSNRPIMVVMGNPPYSVSSNNKSEYIEELLQDYKRDLGERNIQPLSDDYIKFIRFAEHMIAENGEGVVAMITNNSYLDGSIYRQMRKHLLETFDDIYILDLHGSSKKKEVTPDGGKDQNVFNIQQGVGIIVAAKSGKLAEGELANVYHADIYGTRASKFDALNKDVDFQPVEYSVPNYFFTPKDTELEQEYSQFISVRELMPFGDAGIKTHRDKFVIDFNKNKLEDRIKDFYTLSPNEVKQKYELKESESFSIKDRQEKSNFDESKIAQIHYRPFDIRWTYYSKWLMDRPRENTMKHLFHKSNVGIAIGRQGQVVGSMAWNLVSITDGLIDINFYYRGGEIVFPLYLYKEIK